MYDFIDVTENQKAQILPSEALNFNGTYFEEEIPGYRTLYVSGREMAETEISDLESATRNGSRYQRRRYRPRTIVVGYQLSAKTNEEFRSAYNKLNELLDVEQARLIFRDEPDKFYVGTKIGAGEVPYGRNAITSQLEFYCADPFKYSVKEYEEVPEADDGTTFAIRYNGTQPAYPILETTAQSELGYVAFLNDRAKILQIGNVDEVDEELKEYSERLIEVSFANYKEAEWSKNNATVVDAMSPWNQSGSMGIGSSTGRKALEATNYSSGGAWHGPGISRAIPEDSNGHTGAKNFTFEFRNFINGNSTAMGDAEFVITAKDASGRRYNLAGIAFWKTQAGLNGQIGVYSLGKLKKMISASFNNNSKLRYANHSITKFGSTLTFDVCGQKIQVTDAAIKDLEATEIGICLAQWGNTGRLTSAVDWVRFTTHGVTKWVDVPNKMTNGDVVIADCNTAEITVNGISHPELGALGNDWEEFCLRPGTNQIQCQYSEWGEKPAYKLRYREVYI